MANIANTTREEEGKGEEEEKAGEEPFFVRLESDRPWQEPERLTNPCIHVCSTRRKKRRQSIHKQNFLVPHPFKEPPQNHNGHFFLVSNKRRGLASSFFQPLAFKLTSAFLRPPSPSKKKEYGLWASGHAHPTFFILSPAN